jgi:hypothetical protein
MIGENSRTHLRTQPDLSWTPSSSAPKAAKNNLDSEFCTPEFEKENKQNQNQGAPPSPQTPEQAQGGHVKNLFASGGKMEGEGPRWMFGLTEEDENIRNSEDQMHDEHLTDAVACLSIKLPSKIPRAIESNSKLRLVLSHPPSPFLSRTHSHPFA